MSERTAGRSGVSTDAFETVAEDTLTTRERYQRWFDRGVLAPARVVWDDRRARVGVVIVAFYALLGTVGPLVVAEPRVNQGPRLLGAFQSLANPLGTDNLGRDVLSQLVHATPNMLVMIVAGGLFTTIVATVVGTVSGYVGGRVDRVLSGISDIVMTIPGLPLVVILAAAFSPENPVVLGVLLTINAWAGLARSIRSQVLSIRRASYVEASSAIGLSTPTIIRRDVLPNVMPYVMINFVNASRNVIFASVGLYFIGVLPYSGPVNWGVMIQLAYSNGGALLSLAAAHWLLAPLFTIVLLSFGLIMLSQGTDRMFNPRVRARHASSTKKTDEIVTDGGER